MENTAMTGDKIALVYSYNDLAEQQKLKSQDIGEATVGDGTVLGLNATRQILIHFEKNHLKIEFVLGKNYLGRHIIFEFRNLTKAFSGTFQLVGTTPLPANRFSTLGDLFSVDLSDINFVGPTAVEFVLTPPIQEPFVYESIPLETFKLEGDSRLYEGAIQLMQNGSTTRNVVSLVSFAWDALGNTIYSDGPILTTTYGEKVLPCTGSGTHTFDPPYTGPLTVSISYLPGSMRMPLLAQFHDFRCIA